MVIPLTRMFVFALDAIKNLRQRRIALSLISLLLFSAQSSFAQSASQTPAVSRRLIESGRGILRVDEDIYFDHEVLSVIEQMKIFICAFPSSQIQLLLDFDLSKANKLAEVIKNGGPKSGDESQMLFPIILAIKLSTSMKSSSVVVLPETKQLFLKSIKEYNCLAHSDSRTEKELLSWLEAEVFLRARFSGEGGVVDPDQLKAKKEALLASWQAQYPHQIYYSSDEK